MGWMRATLRAVGRVGRWALSENVAVSVALVAGAAGVAAGVAMVHVPAGVITAGVLLIAGSVLYARGSA